MKSDAGAVVLSPARSRAADFSALAKPRLNVLVVASALAGCTSVSYYAQSIEGHVELMAARRNVGKLISDPATPEALRAKLTRASAIRRFATDELALGWPGGIDRLAASDVRVRYQAVDELAARASSDDEPLLLELFSDPEPLMREHALRALYKTSGSKASSALVRLLDDPDPMIAAAAIRTLGDIGDDWAVEVLVGALRGRSEQHSRIASELRN